jgi:hypothetical protein
MKPLPTISNAHHRRKIHFVDETLQKFLLIGLVLLETGLAAGLTWLMFSRLNQIIEITCIAYIWPMAFPS